MVPREPGYWSLLGRRFDPVAYIKEHHDRITHLHIKDRKSNNGPNEPFGEGNTPIKPVLLLLKEKKFQFPRWSNTSTRERERLWRK